MRSGAAQPLALLSLEDAGQELEALSQKVTPNSHISRRGCRKKEPKGPQVHPSCSSQVKTAWAGCCRSPSPALHP